MVAASAVRCLEAVEIVGATSLGLSRRRRRGRRTRVQQRLHRKLRSFENVLMAVRRVDEIVLR